MPTSAFITDTNLSPCQAHLSGTALAPQTPSQLLLLAAAAATPRLPLAAPVDLLSTDNAVALAGPVLSLALKVVVSPPTLITASVPHKRSPFMDEHVVKTPRLTKLRSGSQ